MSNPTYSVFFDNDSTLAGTACLYQILTSPPSGAYVVAWLASYAYPTSTIEFSWSPVWDFVWSQSGQLGGGGAVINAGQVWPVTSMLTANQVTLTSGNGTFTFESQTSGTTANALYIEQDDTIPAYAAAAGIGMDGAAVCVVQASPNVTVSFTLQSEYWIAFGTFTSGQTLQPPINGAVQVSFPANTYAMTATLGANNLITVEATPDIEAARADVRRSRVRFGF
ncbi:MAG TPA: hypothetical protein VM733_16240 [Thermoanaerobaculia bacterium]|nr:hypothetical protein [Thermoanaerobaculia bacterium]